MDFSEQYQIEGRAKHINNSIFIKNLVWSRHYNVTLENSNIMLVSR